MRRRPIPVTGAASGTDEEAMAIVWPERPFSAYVGEYTKMTSVIVGGARTPMGRLLGNLKSFPATALGAAAIKAALERGGVSPEQVQYVIMGQVLQAGAGQMPARQAAVAAGIPMTVPSLTVNKVCLSGMDAIALADQLIRAGEFDIVVAGGMESMTKAPHLLAGQREGYKYGEVTLLDHMAFDGLTDAYDGVSMGESTDRHTKRYGISREEQDAFGAASHQKAAAAQKNGAFAEEITPLPVPQKRGEPVVINEDEGIRPDTTPETLAKLRPAFGADGTITAGTSSPISDGAAAVVVMSETRARQLGLTWLAEIGSHGNPAGPGDHAGPGQGRSVGRRPGPDRDQRGLRGSWCPVDERARSPSRYRQRERRRDRPWPPDRNVRRPPGAHARAGAQAARRRPGRGGAVRRGWAG